MQIIKMGVIPKNSIYQQTCHNCQTVFEYQDLEVQGCGFVMGKLQPQMNCPLCNIRLVPSYQHPARENSLRY